MITRTKQMEIGQAAPLTYADLGYGGDANGLAFWFVADPATGRNVTLIYDRQTGGTRSKPPCPALEPLARFATLVRDSHAALRDCRFTDRQLAGLLETSALLARANRDNEQWQADLEAVRAETDRRARLGPIAEAQRASGDVRRMIDEDLFGGEGC